MKKLLLLLLCVPLITLAQQTYVPDDNFEQHLISLGYDNVLDDYVTTSNINTVPILDVPGSQISDLTGIEDFTLLTKLYCGFNQLTSLDVSNNPFLNTLHCYLNQLTSLDVSNNPSLTDLACFDNPLQILDVSQNTALTYLACGGNQLTSLDVSNNTALSGLGCWQNQLTSLDVSHNTSLNLLWCQGNNLTALDVSNNTALTDLDCSDNQLTSLDIRNGNNIFLDTNFYSSNNPNLYCIDVDDSTWSSNNWTVVNGNIDPQHYFSNNCSGTTDIQEHSTNKELLKVTDILGRDTEKKRNTPLFYIYNDGTVEKKIIIE